MFVDQILVVLVDLRRDVRVAMTAEERVRYERLGEHTVVRVLLGQLERENETIRVRERSGRLVNEFTIAIFKIRIMKTISDLLLHSPSSS